MFFFVVILVIMSSICKDMIIPNFKRLENISSLDIFYQSDRQQSDCFSMSLLILDAVKYDNQSLNYFKDLVHENETFVVCEFNFDNYDVFEHRSFRVDNYSWFCEISKDLVCSGSSDCLTDECDCQNTNAKDVFYCIDGSGCVTFDKLCDSMHDCKDSSDECYCAGSHQLECSGISDSPICIPDFEYCQLIDNDRINRNRKGNCTQLDYYVNCSNIFTAEYSIHEEPLMLCLREAHEKLYESMIIEFIPNDYMPNYCKNNCNLTTDLSGNDFRKLCDHILLGSQSGVANYYMFNFVYSCDQIPYSGNCIPLEAMCDGVQDCSNHADEMGCPGRFYCSQNDNSEWIDVSKVCDNVKDCISGSDECQACDFGFLSSREFLIQSNVVFSFTIVGGVSTLFLNLIMGYKCYKTSFESRAGAHDRIIRLQIFFFDGLMGVYMCLIVVAAIVLRTKGDYCLFQLSWRSSRYCSLLGLIFSFASHGSLLSIVLMGVVRCLVCHGKGRSITHARVISISIILLLFNISNTTLPLLPISAIQNIFRTDLFLTNINKNPFISSNPLNLSRVFDMHARMFSTEHDIYAALKRLNSITSNHNSFDFLEIGYYGNTAQCIHNIFSTQTSYELYKLWYCIIAGVLLSLLTLSYFMIIRKSREYASELAGTGGSKNKAKGTSLLTIKVSLIIITQLSSWSSLILALMYFTYLAKETAPMEVFEWFALVIIPSNSLLNPIFYSDLHKNVASFIWLMWRHFVDRVLVSC